MQKMLLLGDEAIAQGAIDAGLSGIYAYPGTPSTEINEYVERSVEVKEKKIVSCWSVNEKTAAETAIGMSYAGKRAMTCMKHVGLNVAADPFMNSAITGANGGLIFVAADDPSMHSSQNEQDSRYFGKFAQIPVFEPSDQQEAYDMTYHAFDYSEKYNVPVLIRITTRLAHSRAGVQRKETRKQNEINLPKNLRQYVLLPANARNNYKVLLSNQANFEKEAENSSFNQYIEGTDKRLGVLVCGIGYNYLLENFEDHKCPYPILKICQYPLPVSMVERLVSECDEILVLEEGYPLVEETLRGILSSGPKIKGRLSGEIPREGELNSNIVAAALGIKETFGREVPDFLASRPPSFCDGCSHIDSFNALNESIKSFSQGRVMADIGCYTLGALPPFNLVNSCVDMGASITMAKGIADSGVVPAVAVIGDSTFTHSGITALLDAVAYNSPITVLILDNVTTAMTGGQRSIGTGKLDKICSGLGVDSNHIRIIKPLKKNHEENVRIISEEIEYKGVSVIISQRECIQTLNRRVREKFKEQKKES